MAQCFYDEQSLVKKFKPHTAEHIEEKKIRIHGIIQKT